MVNSKPHNCIFSRNIGNLSQSRTVPGTGYLIFTLYFWVVDALALAYEKRVIVRGMKCPMLTACREGCEGVCLWWVLRGDFVGRVDRC